MKLESEKERTEETKKKVKNKQNIEIEMDGKRLKKLGEGGS